MVWRAPPMLAVARTERTDRWTGGNRVDPAFSVEPVGYPADNSLANYSLAAGPI